MSIGNFVLNVKNSIDWDIRNHIYNLTVPETVHSVAQPQSILVLSRKIHYPTTTSLGPPVFHSRKYRNPSAVMDDHKSGKRAVCLEVKSNLLPQPRLNFWSTWLTQSMRLESPCLSLRKSYKYLISTNEPPKWNYSLLDIIPSFVKFAVFTFHSIMCQCVCR